MNQPSNTEAKKDPKKHFMEQKATYIKKTTIITNDIKSSQINLNNKNMVCLHQQQQQKNLFEEAYD